MNSVNNAFVYTKFGPTANITSRFLTLPQIQFPQFSVNVGFVVFVLCLFLVLTLLFLPQFINTLVAEREDKLFALMRISGLKPMAYYGGLYAFNFALFLLWSVVWLLLGTSALSTAS